MITFQVSTSRGHSQVPTRRAGFTLVEMLVTVALVLLMMTLFAQVFQGATKSMNQQKGMAENDQKARRLTILLRKDIESRTFLDVKPFAPRNNTPEFPNTRRGYFSISENDPNNMQDDVLQFTTELSGDFFAGRSTLLKRRTDVVDQSDSDWRKWKVDLARTSMTTEALSLKQYLTGEFTGAITADLDMRNQPEFDDGNPIPNQIGASPRAEVSYFLRNGNLYRRVLLIREAYDARSNSPAEPTGLTGDYDSGVVIYGSGQFWRDFDYSALHRGYDNVAMASRGLKFHWKDSLRNESQGLVLVDPDVGYPLSLGIPHLRFGSTPVRSDGTVNPIGYPREYLNPSDPSTFIGRPTLQECAHAGFGYPGRYNNNPFDTATSLTLNADTRVIDQYSGGIERRGEDIVLTNVHEFDIQVYDDSPAVQSFVQLGNSTGVGYYAANQRLYNAYTPATDVRNNRYDTWHPFATLPQPPYRPVSTGSDGVNGAPGDDDGVNGPDDAGELGFPGTDDEIALKAIRITIRYFDVASNQMRQLSLVHSLTN